MSFSPNQETMNVIDPEYTSVADGKEEVFPDSLVSSVGLIPEVESIVNRIRKGERTLKFHHKKTSFREKVMRLVGRGSVFLTQGRFVDFKYTK